MQRFLIVILLVLASDASIADNRCFEMTWHYIEFDSSKSFMIELPSKPLITKKESPEQLKWVYQFVHDQIIQSSPYPIYLENHLISALDFTNYKSVKALMNKHHIKDRGTQLHFYINMLKYNDLKGFRGVTKVKRINDLENSCFRSIKVDSAKLEILRSQSPTFKVGKSITIDYAEGVEGWVEYIVPSGVLSFEHILSGYEH